MKEDKKRHDYSFVKKIRSFFALFTVWFTPNLMARRTIAEEFGP